MKVDVVLGLQWGDEGKGKIVDVLANTYPVIARFQGGPNAGHSLHFEGKKFVLQFRAVYTLYLNVLQNYMNYFASRRLCRFREPMMLHIF